MTHWPQVFWTVTRNIYAANQCDLTYCRFTLRKTRRSRLTLALFRFRSHKSQKLRKHAQHMLVKLARIWGLPLEVLELGKRSVDPLRRSVHSPDHGCSWLLQPGLYRALHQHQMSPILDSVDRRSFWSMYPVTGVCNVSLVAAGHLYMTRSSPVFLLLFLQHTHPYVCNANDLEDLSHFPEQLACHTRGFQYPCQQRCEHNIDFCRLRLRKQNVPTPHFLLFDHYLA